jgi:hypothetical protein
MLGRRYNTDDKYPCLPVPGENTTLASMVQITMDTSKPNRTKLPLFLGLANLALALIVPILFSFAVSIAYTVVLSAYRVLDDRGAIDHEVLAKTWGPAYARDWGAVVHRLVYDPLMGMLYTGYILAGLFAVNGIVMMVMWRRERRELDSHAG